MFLMDFLAVMGTSIIFLWGLEALCTTTPPTTSHAEREDETKKERKKKPKQGGVDGNPRGCENITLLYEVTQEEEAEENMWRRERQ